MFEQRLTVRYLPGDPENPYILTSPVLSANEKLFLLKELEQYFNGIKISREISLEYSSEDTQNPGICVVVSENELWVSIVGCSITTVKGLLKNICGRLDEEIREYGKLPA